VTELEPLIGIRQACVLTGRARASHYRDVRGPAHGPPAPRCSPPNKLSDAEFDALLDLLRSEPFVDLAPAQVWAILLDAGTYMASISTMYRVLRSQDEVRERRRHATHPARVRPELVARGPNQVWSWDISKLKGPSKGVYYDLYVIIDIFSRYVVGWMVAPTETAELAKTFIAATIKAHAVTTELLTIHADRGTSMTSKPVAALLAELGVTRTHSRPHVSNDNPYSEAAFKTLKYCPAFPDRFGSIEDARAFCVEFFEYYNHHHRSHGVVALWRDVA
jgi:putative transposase